MRKVRQTVATKSTNSSSKDFVKSITKQEVVRFFTPEPFNDDNLTKAVANAFVKATKEAIVQSFNKDRRGSVGALFLEKIRPALKSQRESASFSQCQQAYDEVADRFEALKKSVAKHRRETRRVSTTLVNHTVVLAKDLSSILISFDGSYEAGVVLTLQDLLTRAKTPEEAYSFFEFELSRVHRKLPQTKGAYIMVATDVDGNQETYAGRARNQGNVGNEDGYVRGQANIGGRNTFELFKMVANGKTALFEGRFGQFGRVARIDIIPIFQMNDNRVKTTTADGSFDTYTKALESLAMGLVAGFGITPVSTGLNVQRADDPEAFMIGLAIAYPKTYRDLVILQHYKVLSTWSKEYRIQIMAMDILSRTDDNLTKANDILRANGSVKESALEEKYQSRLFKNKTLTVVEPSTIDMQAIDAEASIAFGKLVNKIDGTQDIRHRRISKFIVDHDLNFHNIMLLGDYAERVHAVSDIFSDVPVTDLKQVFSHNGNQRIVQKQVDISRPDLSTMSLQDAMDREDAYKAELSTEQLNRLVDNDEIDISR